MFTIKLEDHQIIIVCKQSVSRFPDLQKLSMFVYLVDPLTVFDTTRRNKPWNLLKNGPEWPVVRNITFFIDGRFSKPIELYCTRCERTHFRWDVIGQWMFTLNLEDHQIIRAYKQSDSLFPVLQKQSMFLKRLESSQVSIGCPFPWKRSSAVILTL